MLGDLIYEGKNRTITGSRVLNAEENKIEHSSIEEGRFKKDIQITILGTFGTIPVD